MAALTTTRNFYKMDMLFMWTFGAILAIFSGLATGLGGGSVQGIQGCKDVRHAYYAKGFSQNDVPDNAISGENLRICSQGFGCCTPAMEEKLSTTSASEFEDKVYEKSSMLRDYFVRRTERFDEFFKALMDNGHTDLNDLFVRTYGTLYVQHSQVFEDLFENLKGYYYGVDVDLIQVMEDFFVVLMQRMFKLLNPRYNYDDEFWGCMTQYMDDLKPFGEVPAKLTTQVKRAFIAARTFVQGLAIGRDLVIRVSKVMPTNDCQKALMRMSYCPHCRGVPYVKPCDQLCLNVMKGCLASQAELDAEWNDYIDAMLMLADRLEGPFNIEAVVDNLDVKISTAIMIMQENSMSISSKVFSGCRTPGAIGKREASSPGDEARGRTTRERERGGGDRDRGGRERGGGGQDGAGEGGRERGGEDGDDIRDRFQGNQPRPTTAAGTNLERLVKDVRSHIKEYRRFWTYLPYMICDDSDIAADTSEEGNCWNGQRVGSYEHAIIGDGIAAQVQNPEVEVNQRADFIVRQQIVQLRTITNKLNSAYNGEDVEWIDNGDVWYGGSGSGSGSGSGDGVDDPSKPNDYTFTETTVEDPIYRPTRKPAKKGAGMSLHSHLSWLTLLLIGLFSSCVCS